MKKGKVRKIVILIIVACMILTVLGCVAWKKRIGIYNTYMKMTGREPSRTTQWVLKGKEIGYHKQVIKTGKNSQKLYRLRTMEAIWRKWNPLLRRRLPGWIRL